MSQGSIRTAARLGLLGACAAAFQTLFAREFLGAFSGSEAALAAVFGPWFVLTALGAALGRGRGPIRLSASLMAYGPLAAATLAAARVLPRSFPAGAAPGAVSAIGWAVALLAPTCILSGASFGWMAAEAGAAYLAESLGSAIAGAALSLVLLGRVPAFALAGGILAASFLAAALGLSRRAAGVVFAAGLALAVPFFVLPVDLWASALEAPHLAPRSRFESPYGSILVAGSRGESTVIVDRRPVASASDVAAAEELADLPLALHPEPRAVAILGAPPVGTIHELLRHGVQRVDDLVEDPVLLRILQTEYGDFQGARLVAADPRRWLAEHPGAYDVVLLAAREPTSAQLNRFFTAEAFRAVASSLRAGGIFAVALDGDEAFASQETRRLRSSVRATIESALGRVQIYPLERTLYVAAPDRALPEPSQAAPVIAAALDARHLAPVHLTRAALGQLLSPQRCADAARWASLPEPANQDLNPTTYRLALDRVLAEFGDLGVGALAVLAGALALAAALAFNPRRRPVPFAVATSGAAGLASQLVLMLAYQAGTGALYRELGLVLAGFMAGAAAGAALGRMGGAPRRLVLLLDLGQVAVPIALLALVAPLSSGTAARALAFAGAALIGVLPGAQFAAAGRISGERPGALYAADLVGAAVAALVTFTLVVPALGIRGALVAVAALKVVSSAALLIPARSEAESRAPSLAPLVPLALISFVLLAAADASEAPLYAFTFLRPYQALAAGGMVLAALAALEPAPVRAAVANLSRRLSSWRDQAGVAAGRLLQFGLLLPVAAFPVARCYFKVPFVFCHVCPRQCAFGVLRPYAVPAAVLANLQGHRFCERVCPLGTAQAACERVLGGRARRVTSLWLPRAAAALFVAIAWFWARADRGEGVSGGPFYSEFFRNAFTPSLWVLGSAAALLVASLVVRRPFCEAVCPIGAVGQLTDALQRSMAPAPVPEPQGAGRRVFLRRAVAGCGAVVLAPTAFRDVVLGASEPGLAMGFRNDAPRELDRFSRPASYASSRGSLVQCELCPHACILGENDRGFCRTRVVKNGRLHTVGYGNLCAVHLDPIEKKPLYHYLPRTPILSVAIGGCNLRCLNCQNWEISQKRPEDVAGQGALPEELAATAIEGKVPALAFTYSEPLMAYEYVRDAAALSRERGLKNVLVTAGYVNEKPLRELCRVLDAVTLDVKAFRESFYKEVSGGRLSPVLRTLEVLREEKVWTEVSFLMVPSLSDSPLEIADFARWVATRLGPGTPFHILRFHPAHRLDHLPPTPISAMEEARKRSLDAGLQFVYLGNVPGNDANNTRCPKDGRMLIERDGYQVKRFEIVGGRCPCGEPIPGVWT